MFAFLTASKPTPTSRTLFWVGVAALLVRFLYFAEHAGSAFFNITILDERFYDAVARALSEGRDTTGLNPGFRPWLYPFFLSLFYRLDVEWGYVLALIAQHLLGALTAVLVSALAIKLFDSPKAGAIAGLLYVLAGPPLFFEGELLITSVFTFLTTALAWFASRALFIGRGPLWPWVAAGAWIGLATQARPNALLFLAAFPVAALLFRDGERALRNRQAGAALGGALLALIAFAAAQSDLTGRFQLVPGAGGVNFYLGNKTGADGMIPRQDRQVTYGAEYRDSVQVFAEELYRDQLDHEALYREASSDRTLEAAGQESQETSSSDVRADGPLEPSAVSRYWLIRATRDIQSDPLAWLALLGRKALFLTWNHEIPNNKSYAFIQRNESRLLRSLPVRWWLLMSFGVLGFLHAWRFGDRRTLFWIAAILVLHGSGVLLFFVNSRYRIPMWPGMAVLAAGGIVFVLGLLKRRAVSDGVVAGLTLAGLTLISSINWLRVETPGFARDFFFRSLAHLEKNQVDEAHSDALQSVRLDPNAPAARFHLGNVELARGDDDLAYRHYRIASYLSPPEPRIYNNLGIVVEGRDRIPLAYKYYLKALEVAPDYTPALVNAALLELRAGLSSRAREKISRAEALGVTSVPLQCARAFLAINEGRQGEAREIIDRILQASAAQEQVGQEQVRQERTATIKRLIENNNRRFSPAQLGVEGTTETAE